MESDEGQGVEDVGTHQEAGDEDVEGDEGGAVRVVGGDNVIRLADERGLSTDWTPRDAVESVLEQLDELKPETIFIAFADHEGSLHCVKAGTPDKVLLLAQKAALTGLDDYDP